MTIVDYIAQSFGIIGLIATALSFQCKDNKKFFLMMALGGLMYFLNFILIGALGGALFNLVNVVRALLLTKNDKKKWKVITLCALYLVCYVISTILLKGDWFQIVITTIPFIAIFVMTIFMWLGNPKHIRYFQIAYVSPAWIVHNIFNFTLGGIICEIMCMVSAVVSLVRHKNK